MTRLTSWDAIEYAEENGLLLNKFADPTEEARDVAREDPMLIYIDVARQHTWPL